MLQLRAGLAWPYWRVREDGVRFSAIVRGAVLIVSLPVRNGALASV